MIPVLIVTGRDGTEARVTCWDLGADAFLTKPYRQAELIARCQSLVRLKDYVEELEPAESVVFAFARAMEGKSPFTHGHSQRLAVLATRLGEKVGLSESDRTLLYKGALLHDIGKISIPDQILNKPGKLTPEEFECIKRHPSEGARILEGLKSVRELIPLIRWHHERLDGTGYPDGLMGSAIPLTVRILSVADVFDALSSPRPYRDALSVETSLEIMRENADGGGLDPELVEIFVPLVKTETEVLASNLSD